MGKIDFGLRCPICPGTMEFDTDTRFFTCLKCGKSFSREKLLKLEKEK